VDDIDDVLAFMQAIWAVDHELERVSKVMERRIGLTIPQRMTALLIARNPGIVASALAAQLRLHRGTMTGIVQRLETAGLVRRQADANEGRRVGLTLTTAGRRRLAQRSGTFEAAVRHVLAHTRRAELDATSRVLTSLASVLGQGLNGVCDP
jgi:DNA-binding MarR family transcriptional regulator